MKRSDLKVGEKLFYTTSNDWRTPRYSSNGVEVTVVSVEPHLKTRSLGYGKSRIEKCSGGYGVLVKKINGMTGEEFEDVVKLTHLRGPWTETKKQVDEWCAQRDARAKATRDASTQRYEAFLMMQDRVRTLAGADLAGRMQSTSDGYAVRIPVELLESMVVALELLASWKDGVPPVPSSPDPDGELVA